jgi:hypothetical protein
MQHLTFPTYSWQIPSSSLSVAYSSSASQNINLLLRGACCRGVKVTRLSPLLIFRLIIRSLYYQPENVKLCSDTPLLRYTYSVLSIIRVWFIQLADYPCTIRSLITEYLSHKITYYKNTLRIFVPVWLISWRARAHREWEVCEKRTFLSLCLAEAEVGIWNMKFGLSVFLNYKCNPSLRIIPCNREYTIYPYINISCFQFQIPKRKTECTILVR